MADDTRLKTMEAQLQDLKQFKAMAREFIESTQRFVEESRENQDQNRRFVEEVGRNTDRRLENADRKMDQLTEMVRSLLPKDNSRSEGTLAVQQQRRVLGSGNVLGSSSSSWMREIGGASNWQSNRVRDGYDRNSTGAPEFRSARTTSVGSFGEWSSEFTQDSVTVKDDATSKVQSPTPAILEMDSNLVIEEMHHDVLSYTPPNLDEDPKELKKSIDGRVETEVMHRDMIFYTPPDGNNHIPKLEFVVGDVRLKGVVESREISMESLAFLNAYKVFEEMPSRKIGVPKTLVVTAQLVSVYAEARTLYATTQRRLNFPSLIGHYNSSFVFDPGGWFAETFGAGVHVLLLNLLHFVRLSLNVMAGASSASVDASVHLILLNIVHKLVRPIDSIGW